MKNISSEKIFLEIKKVFYRFPLAVLFSGIITGLNIYDDSFLFIMDNPMYLTLTLGFIFSVITQYIYEEFFDGRIEIRWLAYGVMFLLLGLYYFLTSNSLSLIDGDWDLYSIPGIRSMILYYVSIVVLVWIPTIKKRVRFSDSFLALFKSFYISIFFSVVLFLGISSIIVLFQTLFFTLSADWWLYTSTIVFSFFRPVLFLTLLLDKNTEKDAESEVESTKMSKFLYNLITYIFIPVSGFLTGIIVLYIFTNLTTVFFTENALETMILSHTISGWVLLVLADSIDNTLGKWFKKIFPVTLIFVLILQMISTYLQIKRVGVTHGRYLILLFGIGSVISAVWYILKQQDLQLVPVVALVAGIISFVPPIDAMSVSVRQQVNRINTTLKEYEILGDHDEIYPDTENEVSEYKQEEVIDGINYLKDIKALNQLTWLPESSYGQADEYLGFTVKESIFSPGTPDIDDPDTSSEETDISLENKNVSLPINQFEQFFEISLNSDRPDFRDEVDIDGKTYDLEVIFNDDFIVTLMPEDSNDWLIFDFSYLLEDYRGEEEFDLSIEELTFTEEDGDVEVQLTIQNLMITETYQETEFYLFF